MPQLKLGAILPPLKVEPAGGIGQLQLVVEGVHIVFLAIGQRTAAEILGRVGIGTHDNGIGPIGRIELPAFGYQQFEIGIVHDIVYRHRHRL